MIARRAGLALGFCWIASICIGGATAAELPSRRAKAKPAEPHARTCEIDGAQGVELPGGGCVRISGYVSAGVSAGTAKH